MKLKIGVVGYGFAKEFIPLFQAHPDVEKVVIAELVPERREEMVKEFGITDVYKSFDDMIQSGKDLDCIALFTSRHMHGPMAYVQKKNNPDAMQKLINAGYQNDVSEIQIERDKKIPNALKKIGGSHMGPHPFLIDDFVRAVATGKLPPCHAWASARWMLPGIIAHQSAMRNGESMAIPDFGDPPADWDMLEIK